MEQDKQQEIGKTYRYRFQIHLQMH